MEIRDLISRIEGENSLGAPRTYSKLLTIGLEDVSETTVSRYLRKLRSEHPERKAGTSSRLLFIWKYLRIEKIRIHHAGKKHEHKKK